MKKPVQHYAFSPILRLLNTFKNKDKTQNKLLSFAQTTMQPVPPTLPPVPEEYDWERFREHGHKVVDFIADYHLKLKKREIPVQPTVHPNYLIKELPAATDGIPNEPVGFDVVMDDIAKHILPGMTHWQHPDFFAWFPSQLSPPALLGEMIASSINQPGFNWMASPAATELEVIVMNWITKAFGMPRDFSWEGSGCATLQPTATEAGIIVIIAAQNKALERFCTNEEKQAARAKLAMYLSDQAHFCMEKASTIVSIAYLRKLKATREHTGNYELTGKTLREAVEKDIHDGLIPFMVSANYGTTSTCAIDDFIGISEVCEKYNMWLNVDAAYAGATAICPEMRQPLLPVFEHASSILINASKWFNTMFNASLFFCRQRRFVVQSLNATGVYLDNAHTSSNSVVDLKDYHLGLGRPFRALKMYTTLRCFGLEGMQSTIRRHCRLAQYLYSLLAQHPDLIELPMEARFGLVCFRLSGDASDAATKAFLHMTEENARFMLTGFRENGVTLVRVSLAYPALDIEDMRNLCQHVITFATKAKEQRLQ